MFAPAGGQAYLLATPSTQSSRDSADSLKMTRVPMAQTLLHMAATPDSRMIRETNGRRLRKRRRQMHSVNMRFKRQRPPPIMSRERHPNTRGKPQSGVHKLRMVLTLAALVSAGEQRLKER